MTTELADALLPDAALDEYLVRITKNQGAKSIPLGLEDPILTRWQLIHSLGEHRQQRRVYGKVHVSWYNGRVVLAVAGAH